MTKFKKGQRVQLANLKNGIGGEYLPSESNKVGNVGTVLQAHDCGSRPSLYDVVWDNGTDNSYIEDNLAPLIMEENV